MVKCGIVKRVESTACHSSHGRGPPERTERKTSSRSPIKQTPSATGRNISGGCAFSRPGRPTLRRKHSKPIRTLAKRMLHFVAQPALAFLPYCMRPAKHFLHIKESPAKNVGMGKLRVHLCATSTDKHDAHNSATPIT